MTWQYLNLPEAARSFARRKLSMKTGRDLQLEGKDGRRFAAGRPIAAANAGICIGSLFVTGLVLNRYGISELEGILYGASLAAACLLYIRPNSPAFRWIALITTLPFFASALVVLWALTLSGEEWAILSASAAAWLHFAALMLWQAVYAVLIVNCIVAERRRRETATVALGGKSE